MRKWWEEVRAGRVGDPRAAAEAVFRLEGKLCVVGPYWIECRICGSQSRNPNDRANLYCARCHLFLGDLEKEFQSR